MVAFTLPVQVEGCVNRYETEIERDRHMEKLHCWALNKTRCLWKFDCSNIAVISIPNVLDFHLYYNGKMPIEERLQFCRLVFNQLKTFDFLPSCSKCFNWYLKYILPWYLVATHEWDRLLALVTFSQVLLLQCKIGLKFVFLTLNCLCRG